MLFKLNTLVGLSVCSSSLVSATAIPTILTRDVLEPNLFTSIVPSTNLTWVPCLTGFFCAVLDVPLDYGNPNGARAFVPLLKYPASTTPYKGIVMTNPGGPGLSAIDFLIQNAAASPPIIGTNYDVVAWEPRGIGYSRPLADCGPAPAKSRLKRGVVFPSNKPFGPTIPDQDFQDEYDSDKALGIQCQAAIGGSNGAGPHMSSAVVTQDVISILDAYARSSYSSGVSNSNLWNYLGFSYGTVIGQTFASMFPDRVGRVILDGNFDPADYTAGLYLKNVLSADEAFSSFFVYCFAAGPSTSSGSGCPYYAGPAAHDIYLRFERTAFRLNARLAADQGWENATAIYQGLLNLKTLSSAALYQPFSGFPQLAEILLYFESQIQNFTLSSIEGLKNFTGSDLAAQISGPPPEWETGVRCTDNGNVLNGRTLAQLAPVSLLIRAESYIIGDFWSNWRTSCVAWSIPDTGRFSGPFGGKTKNPILFVGNTRDPVTPLINAQNGIKIFKGAQLLTVDGTGHTAPSTVNFCALGNINTFFQTGALPQDQTFCPLEAGPFGVALSNGVLGRDLERIQHGLKDLLSRYAGERIS